MSNRVVHFEIPATEPEKLTKFYGDLFGWTFQKAPIPGMEYWLCNSGNDGPGINGAIMQRMHPTHPITNYVEVANVEAALASATKLGATVALAKQEVPETGFVAAILDPQGNICGLWEPLKR